LEHPERLKRTELVAAQVQRADTVKELTALRGKHDWAEDFLEDSLGGAESEEEGEGGGEGEGEEAEGKDGQAAEEGAEGGAEAGAAQAEETGVSKADMAR